MSPLKQAIQAIKNNDKRAAERLLREVLAAEPDNEAAWLWLAVAENNETAKRDHLNRVLELNPANEVARNALAKLDNAAVSLPTLDDIMPVSLEKSKPVNAGHGWLWAAIVPFCLLVGIFLMLLLLNPEYIGRMLLPCSTRDTLLCSQPLGWLMSLFGLVLPACGLLLIVGLDFWLSPERITLRVLAVVLYQFLIIVPAIFIVLLGPAALVITETPGLGF